MPDSSLCREFFAALPASLPPLQHYSKQSLPPAFFCCIVLYVRACSSADRAFASGAKGRGFDPLHAHRKPPSGFPERRLFLQAQPVRIPGVEVHVIGQYFIRRDLSAVYITDHLVKVSYKIMPKPALRLSTEDTVRKKQDLVNG